VFCWEVNRDVWVEYFPLVNATAMTIHKVISQTLDKAKICLGDTEKIASLGYVALSRVGQLSDVMITPPYPNLNDYWTVGPKMYYKMVQKEKERVDELVKATRAAEPTQTNKDKYRCLYCSRGGFITSQLLRKRKRIMPNPPPTSESSSESSSESELEIVQVVSMAEQSSITSLQNE